MRHTLSICFLALILALPASAAERKSVTFFSDGALVEIESQASGGSFTHPLPPRLIDGTLRITPLDGAAIKHVELMPATRTGKHEKELDALLEQKNRLEDRLQALSTREEIFKAAAKSQSGKAPRKTKTNPDPLQSIRQGTDFAIAQLEAVYTARRKAEREIRRVDARLSAIRTNGTGADMHAKVTVHPKNGRVRITYALAEPAWIPRYDLRLNGSGAAKLSVYGILPEGFDRYLLRAAFGPMRFGSGEKLFTLTGKGAKMAEYQLTTSRETIKDTVPPSFSYVLTNMNPVDLPAGETTFFYRDEYRGRFRFEGISSGRSKLTTQGT